jgi:hypothetical protein
MTLIKWLQKLPRAPELPKIAKIENQKPVCREERLGGAIAKDAAPGSFGTLSTPCIVSSGSGWQVRESIAVIARDLVIGWSERQDLHHGDRKKKNLLPQICADGRRWGRTEGSPLIDTDRKTRIRRARAPALQSPIFSNRLFSKPVAKIAGIAKIENLRRLKHKRTEDTEPFAPHPAFL